jgi:DNA (cytosine-5)-methyltransferase 1
VKVGSLFSGIGGLDLGLERAGMQVVYQVEKDPYCQKVLAKHWPTVPRYGDIKEIDFSTLPAVDLICGGFPCQPVSCAGKRQGDKDKRWLWPEFYRAICEARPRWVLVENVPGLLSVADGRLFGGILGDLARSGYNAEWDLLPAAAFGAPHLRFRLFLVAHARSCSGIGRPFEPGREEERGIAPGGHGEVVAYPELRGRNEGTETTGWQEGIAVDRLRRNGR